MYVSLCVQCNEVVMRIHVCLYHVYCVWLSMCVQIDVFVSPHRLGIRGDDLIVTDTAFPIQSG